MKKKQTSETTVTANNEGESSAINGDIKTLVKEHAKFFDKLVELIPAKFYLPTNDDEKPWFQGLSKSAKAKAKQKSIENTKKSRRERLDPEKASKTTLDLLKESIEAENKASSDGDDDVEEGGLKVKEDKRSVTYEELRMRLHKRIEELRACRGDGSGEGKRRRYEERRERDGFKRKREEEKEEGSGGDAAKEKEEKESERDVEKEASEAAKGIEFGKVKLAASNDEGKKKKRRLSKEKELARAIKLEESKKDPEVGKKHSWKAATERAMGTKVHDNPKLLKKSLQKDKKKHIKSVEKWKQRVETTEKMKKGKQDKRRDNIKAKLDKKKQAKIDKREKKLMRPGFEGRKEGFVTGN